MNRWLARPDGGVGLAVLLVAVFNFTPAQFSSGYMGEAGIWLRVVKDGPILLLIAALIGHHLSRPSPARAALAGLWRRASWRALHASEGADAVLATLAVTVAVLALFITLSTVWTGNGELLGSLVSARYYVLYPAVAVLLAFSGPFETRYLAAGVVFLGVVQTGLATADYAGLFGATYYAAQVEFAGYAFPRAIGTLGNPNNLGLFLGFASLVVVATARRRTAVGKVLLVILSFGIVLSGSKTALIATALAWSILLWRGRSHQRSWGKVLLAGGIVAASVAGGVLMASHRLGAEPTLAGAFGTHGETAQAAVERWFESPETVLIGHGFAAQTSVGPGGRIQENTVDTMVLALAVEGGLVAILVFALLVVLGVRLILLCPPESSLRRVALGFAIIMVVYTPVAVSFRLFPGALVFWVLVGLCGSVARGQITTHRAIAATPQRARAAHGSSS